jgi:hypothetical protein
MGGRDFPFDRSVSAGMRMIGAKCDLATGVKRLLARMIAIISWPSANQAHPGRASNAATKRVMKTIDFRVCPNSESIIVEWFSAVNVLATQSYLDLVALTLAHFGW